MNYLEPVWMRSGPVPKGTGRRAARVYIPSLVVPWPTIALVGLMGSVQNVSQLEEFLGVHGVLSKSYGVQAVHTADAHATTDPAGFELGKDQTKVRAHHGCGLPSRVADEKPNLRFARIADRGLCRGV